MGNTSLLDEEKGKVNVVSVICGNTSRKREGEEGERYMYKSNIKVKVDKNFECRENIQTLFRFSPQGLTPSAPKT